MWDLELEIGPPRMCSQVQVASETNRDGLEDLCAVMVILCTKECANAQNIVVSVWA
jgi:hypothetical protein